MQSLKKGLSLLLAVMMVVSLITVMATATGAVTYEDTKLYFDVSTTGWELGSKDKVGFYVYGPEGELLPWGGKKLNGTDEGDGIWSYDPAAKGMNIEEGKQYAIIFTGAGNQTYDLLFDTTCYGHVAYCDGTMYENPVDSSKVAQAAFWKDLDASKYGPKLQISSVGTVVGTCPEEGKTPATIFEDFLTNTLENARQFKVDTGEMTEQELIDGIGKGLGLTKEDVAAAIEDAAVETAWNADDSTLPGAAVPETEAPATEAPLNLDDTKLYFDASTTGWELGSKDKVGFYVYGPEGELLPWGGKKLNGTLMAGSDSIWEYDPAAKGMTIEEGKQYAIIFTGAGNQTYDLLFDTTCFGHVAYCDGTMYENPVDSSKEAQAAFWKDLDASKYGPKLQISSVGTVVGTCPEEGKTPATIFEDFLTNTLENARQFKVDTGEMTEQELIDGIGEGLGLTKQEVFDAIAETGVETAWDYAVSTLPGDVVIPTEVPETQAPETQAPETQAPETQAPETQAPETQTPETQAPETQAPETEAPVSGAKYYIVGNMTNWQVDDAYEMALDESVSIEQYIFEDMEITETTQFKVVKVEDGQQTWYPDGMGNNYGENGEITAAGTYDVLFIPSGIGDDGWFYGCIKVVGMPAPETQAPETQAPETQAPETQTIETVSPEPGEPTYYVVGSFTDWQVNEAYMMTKIAEGEKIMYKYDDLALAAADQFKIVSVNWSIQDAPQVWYPDGMGNNYGENGEITAAGTYDVYFDPAVATDGWFYNCIYVDGMPVPTQSPETTEPSTEPAVRPIEAMPFVDDVVAEAGIEDTFTVYFQMPMDGDINWANEYNEIDGQNYAGIYWWQGSKDLNPWPGAKMTLVDAEQGIFSANVPYEPDVLTTIIFNNAIDGGTDKTAAVYSAAHQTANLNCQGYDEGDSDTMPEGTAADNFDGCIFVIDPDTLDVNQFSGKDTIDGNWYVYYGNGCYGMYAETSTHFTSVEENCCNPAHNHGGQPAEKTVLGDVDGDGEATVIDATYIQRYATRVSVPFTDEQMAIGDVDRDGETTVVDATYIQRFATRIPVPYPVGAEIKG